MGRLLLATALATTAIVVPPSARPTEAASAGVERLAGADRYATAAAISQATFDPGVEVAYVATGATFPDALSGAAAAAHRSAPLLLTDRTSLPKVLRAELTRLAPKSIVVLGGTGVIADAVMTKLESFTTGTVTRIAGADRYATAARVSRNTFAPGVAVAYVATGQSFPDALTAGAAAARQGGPVLLVKGGSIPQVVRKELTRLRPGRIVVAGGAGVVGDAVLRALDAYTTGSVTRQWGADRYATAAAISAGAFGKASVAYLANGLGFADAVAGVPAAAMERAPLLLATVTSLPAPTINELRRLDPNRVVLLGGTGVLGLAIPSAVRAATAWERVGPHFFREDGYSLHELPDELLPYNGPTIVPIYGNRDSTGAFIYKASDGRWYDHPVGQAQYIVNMLRDYRLDPDPEYLDLAIANGNRLLERAVHYKGAIFFPYPFDFYLHGRGTMHAPWYSGMAQGVALSGFVRLFEVTGDKKWRDAADATFASFLVPRGNGTPWFAVVDGGNLWFEEYPWVPYDHTFNGHNFATYGLVDYWRLTHNDDAATLALGGMTTAAHVSNIVRVPGGISQYCISQSCLDRKVRNVNYHLTHIGQFIQLYRFTREERFAKLADTFTADNPNWKLGGTVIFTAGTHAGYHFDANGVGTVVKTLTLTSRSNAPYEQRTVPYGWIRPGNGIWFFMNGGYFDGLWIRESSKAYARGFVDRLEYYWSRPVAVPAGTRTGYTYDSTGHVTSTKRTSTSATTWRYTASAKINGTRSVLLSTGPLSGFWMPVGGTSAAGLIAAGEPFSADAGQPQPSDHQRAVEPPMQPSEPLIPEPMPGQQELAPADGPPAPEPTPPP